MLVIKNDTDLQTLRTSLMSGRLSAAQAASALEELQALNPHVPLKEANAIPANTVLLVPDAPSFKTSATESVAGGPLEALQKLVRDDLAAAAKRLKAGNAARASQRAEVLSVHKSAAFKKIVERDPELKQQVDDAVKVLKEDQQQATQAEETLEAAMEGTRAELASLAKLLG
jgi:hypothetical protein